MDNDYIEGGKMINFLKKYWKLIFFVFTVILMVSVGFYFDSNNSVATPNDTKLSVSKKEDKEEKEKTSDNETVFVDVKGAVNAPGVYEIDKERRIIDAINLAGGFANGANAINLNLSKKVEDEMYIIVYTQKQIDNYKKSNSNQNLSCAANECICPDKLNDACIKEKNDTSSTNNKKSEQSSKKVSINSASKEELTTLPGIGDSKADLIIKYRNENGTFKNIEDIKNVSGIGDSIYEKIKNNITI